MEPPVFMHSQHRGDMTLNRTRLILITWLLLVIITLAACSQVGDPELLQSHDLSTGYLIIGRYTPYDQGGTALCYHDVNVCILSRVE
jgi:hypothetical protein